LTNFKATKFLIPDELEKDFDWDLLQQLVLGSFSSDYELKTEKDQNPELYIAVKSGDQSVVKKVSELRSFQIQRLYEIYVEEQLNLQILKNEDENEKNAIEQERIMRLKRRQAILDTM
jgi:tRNA A37 N6-isopentenylltransferase MiaA